MDAIHFRNRAARARDMARAGEDALLSQMLLEVANDLEAEADEIEAEGAARQDLPDRKVHQAPGADHAHEAHYAAAVTLSASD